MSIGQAYQLIVLFMEYVSNKEKETALFAILDFIYNEDIVGIEGLMHEAESEEDEWMAKKIKAYIKENGLDDSEEEYDEEW